METQVQAALNSLATKIDPDATSIDQLQQLSGGATQEIWRFTIKSANGDRPLILRRAPGGDRVSTSEVEIEVEAQLLAAAGQIGVPVPGVHHVLAPADGLGRGFIMDFISGEALGTRIVRSPALATARETLAGACGATLAKIHMIDTSLFPALSARAPIDLVGQWRNNYRAGSIARPVFELAFRWLAERAPPPPPKPRLVHGDFRNGNLMIGPEGIRAVLDWELAHIGDPMEDLGWLCVNSWRFGEIDKPVGGFGTYDELYQGYEAAGGVPVDRAAALWWEVFGTIRWGVICAAALATYHHVEPSVERAMIARRASETEIDLLRLFGS